VLNKSFSLAAIESSEGLLVNKVKELCAAIEKRSKDAKSVDLFYAFRCMSVDVITTFCFGKSIHAVDEPDFKAPIVVALEAATPVGMYFKYSDLFKNFILKCPPNLSKKLSPLTAGMIDLNQVIPPTRFAASGLLIYCSYSPRRSTSSPMTRKSSNFFLTT
jgi:hypothetical protein